MRARAHVLDQGETGCWGPGSLELRLDDSRFRDLQPALDYWNALRGERFAPSRREVEPAPLKPLLDRLMIVEVQPEPSPRFRFRLMGSHLYELFGQEFTGSLVDEMRPPALAAVIQRDYQEVVDRRAPALRLVVVQLPGRHFAMGRLVLPLSSDGRGVDRLLCVVSEGPGIYTLLEQSRALPLE